MRRGSFQMALSASMLVSPIRRRSRAQEREGQRRIACEKDSALIWHQGQVSSGSLSNQDGCAAR